MPVNLSGRQRHRRFAIPYILLLLVYVVVRVVVFHGAAVTEFPDSESYLSKANASLLDPDFIAGSGRFFMVPLVYKVTHAVMGPGKEWLTIAQLWVSVCAWVVLAWSFAAGVSRGWPGWSAFASILVFSLHTDVIQWDRTILSESLTLSLFALLLACWIRFGRSVTRGRAAAVLVVSAAWSFSREANSLALIPFAVVLACWTLWYLRGLHRKQIICWVTIAGWVFLALTTQWIAQKGDRWVFPLLNVVGRRVLPSSERISFYQDRGMPVNARLLSMSGEFAAGKNWAFYTAPELAGFREWLYANGKQVFLQDLLLHPGRSAFEPLQDVELFVCPDLRVYRPRHLADAVSSLGGSWLCGRSPSLGVIAGSVAVGFGFLIAAERMKGRVSSAQGFMIVTVAVTLLGWIPLGWFTWQVIGGMEVSRHVLGQTVELRLGFLFLLFFLLVAARQRVSQWIFRL